MQQTEGVGGALEVDAERGLAAAEVGRDMMWPF